MRCVGVGLVVAARVLAASTAHAQQAPPSEAREEARERAALLAQQLPDAVKARSFVALPPLLILSGGVMVAMGIGARWPGAVAGGALALGGGVGFYFMPEQRNYELLGATAMASTGLYYLSLPLPAPHNRWQIPIGAGHLAMSALGFINFAYSSHPGRTRLQRDLERVRTPAARSNLSVEELRQIERDLYATDFFVPQWAMGLPLIVGSLMGSAPLFDADVAGRDKPLIGVIAGTTLIEGLAISLAQTPAAQYRSSLENAGLWVDWRVGPAGISANGSFD
jgi:hypothetical protein